MSDESSRARGEEEQEGGSEAPRKPKDMSEAGHILSASRENVEDNPKPEEVHEAAKMMGHAGGTTRGQQRKEEAAESRATRTDE